MNFTKALSDGLARAKDRVQNALGSNLDAATDEALSVMQSRVPVRTGELKASITREDSGNVRRIRVSSPYALPIEFGTSQSDPQPFWRPGVAVMRRRARARRVRG